MKTKKYYQIAVYNTKEVNEAEQRGELLASCVQIAFFRGIERNNVMGILDAFPCERTFWLWSISDCQSIVIQGDCDFNEQLNSFLK